MGVRGGKDRKVPTQQDKVEALLDRKKFVDILQFHGGMQKFGRIHREVDAFMESKKSEENPTVREMYLLPRGHLKTTWCTVLDVLHSIYINPNIRIYIGSANQALAKKILREVTAYLVDPWLQDNLWNDRPHFDGRLIPLMDRGIKQRRQIIREQNGEFSEVEEEALDTDKKILWRQDVIQVVRPYKLGEPTVTVGSVESPATGFHYDRMYFDDIINFENYDKPEKIERLDVWRNDMFSVIDPVYFDDDLFEILKECSPFKGHWKRFKLMSYVGDFCRVVGTRYYKHDWYKQLIDDEETEYIQFVKNIYVNGENAEDGYLWGERWDEREERKRRKEMSKKHFYAQYLNKIIVEEDQILPFDKVKFLHPALVSKKNGSSHVLIERDGEKREVSLRCVIDPAATCNKESDYTCIVVGGKDSDGYLYVLDLKLLKLPSHKWIKEMYALLTKWDLKGIHLETVGFANELKQTIRSQFNNDGYFPISIRDYKPSNKTSKKERIESGLEPLLSNSMLYLSTYLGGLTALVDQFNFFPAETEKDDGLDGIQILNEVSIKTKKGEKVVPISKYVNKKWGGMR